MALRLVFAVLIVPLGSLLSQDDRLREAGYALSSIEADLPMPPAIEPGPPAAGRRFTEWLPAYVGTDIYHVIYLPSDWRREGRYPIIVEYAGNTPGNDPDPEIGRAEGCKLGFGLSAGKGCIWVCMPYIGTDHKTYQKQWWGDVAATVAYCRQAVPKICDDFGGDSKLVFIAGFSRGSIACNFIGLHDDEIAKLWCGFICHSHYDGARQWNYEGSDPESAAKRLARLGDRPQWISHEQSDKISLAQTRDFVKKYLPAGRFTFISMPFTDHSPLWVYRDIPQRQQLRDWFDGVVRDRQRQP